MTLGLTCWFTFAFTETFAVTRRPWLSFRASDSIWVFFNNVLLTSHQGHSFSHPFTSSVGIDVEEHIDLTQRVTALSRGYYSLHVFAASRSCVTNASLFSSFHWTTSSPALSALEGLLNQQVVLTADNTEGAGVTWERGVALLSKDSFLRLALPQSPFYRVAAELQLHSFSVESYLCLVVHGVRATRPAAIRAGVDVGTLSASPCEMNGATVAVMLTAGSGRAWSV